MSAVEQLASRGRRRRGVESSSYARQQQEARRALYHCNYCHRDISSSIRIKCAVCQDFDLCLTCFSVGVELAGHKNTHSYRVIDNLGFPLLHPDWGADEELLLLEGIDIYGLGNWLAVSEHVGTKKMEECQQHYFKTYIEPDSFPLPSRAPELQGVDLAALAAAYRGGRHKKRPASSLDPQPPSAAAAAAAAAAAEGSARSTPGVGGGWLGCDGGLPGALLGSDGGGGDAISRDAAVKLEETAGKLEEAEGAKPQPQQQQQQQQHAQDQPGEGATKRQRTGDAQAAVGPRYGSGGGGAQLLLS